MSKLLLVLILAAVVVAVFACKAGGKGDAYRTVGVGEFETVATGAADSVVVVDVRTPSEYAEGHLARALLIDVGDSAFLGHCREQLPVGKTVAVYCRSGRRSARAADMLAAEGYTVVNLRGGIMAWKLAGKPVVK